MTNFFLRLGRLSAILACLFQCFGCAALLSSPASTAISLGSLGQTLIRATYLLSDKEGIPVAPMPRHYQNDHLRMVREAWEQNYQLFKQVSWEEEDIPWNDLAKMALRKSGGEKPVLVLVKKVPLGHRVITEERVFFATPSRRLLRDPAEAAGEAYYPESRIQQRNTAIYAYTAFYFTRGRQPSGLLLAETPETVLLQGKPKSGIRILAVGKSSPAYQATLRSGDIILQINGCDAEYANVLSNMVNGSNNLVIYRGGTLLHATLMQRYPER